MENIKVGLRIRPLQEKEFQLNEFNMWELTEQGNSLLI
jgi:hypothetical protein